MRSAQAPRVRRSLLCPLSCRDGTAALHRSDRSVRIAGAGIAGLAAAVTLARYGREVEVFERGARPGGHHRGDFQGLENWTAEEDVLVELARLGFPGIGQVARPISEMEFHGPDGNRIRIRTHRPLFYLVRRGGEPGTLDSHLADIAASAGVTIRYRSPIRYRAECNIVATGAQRADSIAAGYHFRTDAPDTAVGVVNNRLAPWGYAYLLVSGGRGVLGAILCRGFRLADAYRERTLRYFRATVPIEMRELTPFGGIGSFFLLPRPRVGSVLYAGEAGGFQDALWGFGMRYAFRSGVLAARALLGELDYEVACRAAFERSVEAAILNRVIWSLGGHAGYRAMLRRLHSHPDPWRLFHRAYNPGSTRRVLARTARTLFGFRLRVRFCDCADCACLWCRHGRWKPVLT